MNEKPIFFKTEMVRAILEGRKTMTRRVIKLQPFTHREMGFGFPTSYGGFVSQTQIASSALYAQIGKHLWVKETFLPKASGTIYKADYDSMEAAGLGALYGGWKSPLFMSRNQSRITLEVTNVRVEQLQEISDQDAFKEGCPKEYIPNKYHTPKVFFYELWNLIQKKQGCLWEDNPWVWVIEFKQINSSCDSSGKSSARAFAGSIHVRSTNL